jgi:predicted GNAT superfamily acetyltransferase
MNGETTPALGREAGAVSHSHVTGDTATERHTGKTFRLTVVPARWNRQRGGSTIFAWTGAWSLPANCLLSALLAFS